MIRFMINSLTGSFMRTLGRILCYFAIALLIYFVLDKINIDWKVFIR